MFEIYQTNIETKISRVLKYEKNGWLINNYFDKNMFFIIQKYENKTIMINIAFCLQNAEKIKLTEKARELGISYHNNSFTYNPTFSKYTYVLYINERQKNRFINYYDTIIKYEIDMKYDLIEGERKENVIQMTKDKFNKNPKEIISSYNGLYKNELVGWFKDKNWDINKKVIKYFGQYGHICSFIKIINDAIDKKLDDVVIFEYDIQIKKDISKHLINFNSISRECDMIYFGYSTHYNTMIDNKKLKSKNITGTFAIYLKNTIFKDLLELLKLYILPTDEIFTIIQKRVKTYTYPNIIISDITSSSIMPKINKDEDLYVKKFGWNKNEYIFDNQTISYKNKISTSIILNITEDNIIKLTDTLNSLLNQTNEEFEIVVFNYNISDTVRIYLHTMKNKDERIKLVDNSREIKYNGEYIFYANINTIYYENVLEKFVENIEDYDIVLSSTINLDYNVVKEQIIKNIKTRKLAEEY